MKKILSFVVAMVLLLGSTAIPASANADYVEFEFRIYDDEAFLERYNGYEDAIVDIPSTYQGIPVTYIDQSAFANNTVIETVNIPDTVTNIGYKAFMGCKNLRTVTLPDALETIQAYAFYECPNLLEITIPKFVLEIQSKALGYVGDQKTGDDFVLESLVINGYTHSIAETYASNNGLSFFSIGVAPLYIYEVEESYGDEPARARITKYLGAQEDVNVPSVIDGYEIVGIFNEAFSGNDYIKTVTIPGSIYHIYSRAFAGCNRLEKVTFRSETITIGEEAFYDCTLLSDFVFAPDAPYFNPEYDKVSVCVDVQALDGTAYYDNNFKNGVLYLETSLVKVDRSVDRFTIPSFVRFISPEAFKECVNLKTIYIPETVDEIGERAFEGCCLLSTVEFAPDSRCYLEDLAFLNCNLIKSVKFPQEVYPSRRSIGFTYEYVEEFGCWSYVKQPDFKVYGVKGSEAEQFASRNDFEFLEYDFSSHTHRYDNACDTDCNACGDVRTITHTYTPATCTKPATCKCGATNGVALGHKYITTTVKATLSKNGSVVKKCTDCGAVASKTTTQKIKSVKLSATAYAYNGKAKSPSVVVKDAAGKTLKKNTDYTVSYAKGRKNVGAYKVTVTFKGNYSGKKVLTFTINPPATKISKLAAAKKSLKVTVGKKTTQTTGYEVQYATSKTFKSAKTKVVKSAKTTSLTLKSLNAKKTYYVRVRTYKTVSGKKYYSAWSAVKSKKTK